MFNSYETNNSLKINAVSGTLLKNHPKSKFVVCDKDDKVFRRSNPCIWNGINDVPVVVLQDEMQVPLCSFRRNDDATD